MESGKKFQAVLTEFKDGPYLAEVEGRELKENEVLVKIEAAPINPSDDYLAHGKYGESRLPKAPSGLGYDGAGTVVEVSSQF